MNRLCLKTKLIAGLVMGGMVLSSASSVFAASNLNVATKLSNQATQSHKFSKPCRCNGTDMSARFEVQLKIAVTAGIITQGECDKILAYEATTKENKEKTGEQGNTDKSLKHNMFSDLVANNIITKAKADALKVNFEAQRTVQRKQNIDTKLKALVADNTITKDQATKIASAITADEATKKVTREKVELMTKSERKIYFDSMKADKVNLLKKLVTDGTITQAQADKLAILSHKDGMRHESDKKMHQQ